MDTVQKLLNSIYKIRDPEQIMLTTEQPVRTQGKSCRSLPGMLKSWMVLMGKGTGNGNRIQKLETNCIVS